MLVNEAKDVIVNEIARQADLDGGSLSDLERRMLYFTESGDCPEDVFKLNEEFEAEYDTEEYEKKIAGIAKRSYKRLKKGDPGATKLWDEAVRELNKGDHYILLMVPHRGRQIGAPDVISNLPPSFWKTSALLVLLVLVGIVTIATLNHYDFHIFDGTKNHKGIPASGTYAQVPAWVQRSLFAVLVGGYICAVASPTINRFFASSARKIFGTFRKQ